MMLSTIGILMIAGGWFVAGHLTKWSPYEKMFWILISVSAVCQVYYVEFALTMEDKIDFLMDYIILLYFFLANTLLIWMKKL